MKARILPLDEWKRLDSTDLKEQWPLLNPETTRIVVVEEDEEIVGMWTMLRVVHAEGLWIAPKYRGTFRVTKLLLRWMKSIANGWGVEKVITGSISPHVTDLIMRFGGIPMPCESFVLPAQDFSARRKAQYHDRDLGRAFHAQLASQIQEEQHPRDDSHNERVGLALRTALEEHQPEQAVEEYNSWALDSGYAPIRYLGTIDGRMRADIASAIVEIDQGYNVHVMDMEASSCR